MAHVAAIVEEPVAVDANELCPIPVSEIGTLNNRVKISRSILLVFGCVDRLKAGTGD